MTTPLVSVLIPSYNHSSYIRETIESICNQSYSSIELIVIDDGSKDETVKLINSIQIYIKDNTFNFIFKHRENRGICKTLNEAISLSSGDFISIIASDDIMLPDTITTYVQSMIYSNEYMVSHGDAYIVNSQHVINLSELGDKTSRLCKYEKKTSGYVFEEAIRNPLHTPFLAFYRREVFQTIGLYDESLQFEDVDMYIRLSSSFKLLYIDRPVGVHRIHNSNTSHKKHIIEGGIRSLIKKYSDFDLNCSEDQKLTLISSLKRGDFDYNKWKDLIRSKRKVVGWGTGASYSLFKTKYDIKLDYLIDSDTEKSGLEIDGMIITNPDKLLSENRDEILVLILSSYFGEISTWLDNNNFEHMNSYL
ncbi:MAG: glycosyltransferase [Gammaproteobacteria bacterium]|nr:glycosyltransferase [Gammaproteobacteria bacterium]